MSRTLFYNVRIVDADIDIPHGWLLLNDGLIENFGAGTYDTNTDCSTPTIDSLLNLEGRIIMPGVIDEHVHFREPGMEHKGNIASESRAAAAGGVTSFFDMPNTHPATVSLAAWEQKMGIASIKSAVNYAFYIGVTPNNLPVLNSMDYGFIPGIKLFMGSTTGTSANDSTEFLHRLFADTQATIAVHAEDDTIIKSNLERILQANPEPGVERHPDIRDRVACLNATSLIVDLAKRYRHKTHLMHISTADELQHFTQGDVDEKLVTAETCPQYLFFDRNDYSRLGGRIKCNPAIKDESDRMALCEAVFDGRIDTVATDHAPHLLEEKQGGALKAMSGMPGIQFALPLMLKLATDMKKPLSKVSELMSANPAKLWKVVNRGFIRKGYHADVVILKPETHVVGDNDVESLCGWTPYSGITLYHKVASTWVNGVKVYDSDANVETTMAACPVKFANP